MMNTSSIAAPVLAVALLTALPRPAQAIWGFGKDKDKAEETVAAPSGPRMLKKYHLHIPNRKTEAELKNLLQSKKMFTEDIEVLRRLERTRAAQGLRIQQTLKKDYKINPEIQYGFDVDSGTLFRMDETTNGVERVELMRIEDPQQVQNLNAMLRERGHLNQQVRGLRELRREQEERAKEVEHLLDSKFSLKPDRIYNYNEQEMILYELIPQRPPEQNVRMRVAP